MEITNKSNTAPLSHKVTHIITGLSRGGAENALYRLVSAQPDPTKHSIISLTDDGIFGSRLRALGAEVHCLGLRRGDIASLGGFLRLRSQLSENRPEIVQTWMYHADLIGGIAAVLAGTPICWGIRNSDLSPTGSKRSTRLVAWLCAKLSRFIPNRAITCSSRAADIHRELGYGVAFDVVPNGLDVTAWAPRPELRSHLRGTLGFAAYDFVFAHAARNDPQKDHIRLALAFNRIHAVRPHARLLLCGQGLMAGDTYFESLPFTSSARAAVKALGPRDDLPQLWQAADSFVLSSAYGEAFPNVVAEAMATGLTCIATDVGDSAEIIGNTGQVVPPSNEQELAKAMQSLLDMPANERLHLSRAARLRVEENFTLERMAEGFRQAWDKAISGAVKACAD